MRPMRPVVSGSIVVPEDEGGGAAVGVAVGAAVGVTVGTGEPVGWPEGPGLGLPDGPAGGGALPPDGDGTVEEPLPPPQATRTMQVSETVSHRCTVTTA